MVLVSSGSAYIVADSDGDEQLLDSMGPGDGFGEMALLTGEPRSTAVRAASALTVPRLAGEPFQQWLATRPDLRALIWDVQRALRSHLCALPLFATGVTPAGESRGEHCVQRALGHFRKRAPLLDDLFLAGFIRIVRRQRL